MLKGANLKGGGAAPQRPLLTSRHCQWNSAYNLSNEIACSTFKGAVYVGLTVQIQNIGESIFFTHTPPAPQPPTPPPPPPGLTHMQVARLSTPTGMGTVAERAQRAANRKNTCKFIKQLPQFYNAHASNAHNTTKKRNVLKIEKKHLQIKKTTFGYFTTHMLQMLTTQPKKETRCKKKMIWLCCEYLLCVSLFVCVVSICTICCQTAENIFLICWCFFYLHVFSEVAARWALSATVNERTWWKRCAFCQLATRRAEIQLGKLAVGGFHKPNYRLEVCIPMADPISCAAGLNSWIKHCSGR